MSVRLSLEVMQLLEDAKAATGKSFNQLLEEAAYITYSNMQSQQQDISTVLSKLEQIDAKLDKLALPPESTTSTQLVAQGTTAPKGTTTAMVAQSTTKKPKQTKLDREFDELRKQLALRQQMFKGGSDSEPESELEENLKPTDAIATVEPEPEPTDEPVMSVVDITPTEPVEQPTEPLEPPTATPRTLTKQQLAERLGVMAPGGYKSAFSALGNIKPKNFSSWTSKHDPEAIAWQPLDDSREHWQPV
ncbi:hypothetical protein ABN584_14925 [Gloeocapsa sp. BRSZ]